jgi:hypothetical protein
VDVEAWPTWWKYVKEVALLAKGDANGIGAAHRLTWSGRIPYRLAFESKVTGVKEHEVLEAVASGDLSGTGRWSFREDGGLTQVRYDWQVTTSKAWMNLLAPVLEPVFRWNHDQIMSEGRRALAARLGTKAG